MPPELADATRAALEEREEYILNTLGRLSVGMARSDDPGIKAMLQTHKESYADELNYLQKQLGKKQTGAVSTSTSRSVTPDNYGNTYASHWSGQESGALHIAGAALTGAALLATAPVSVPAMVIGGIIWVGTADEAIQGVREIATDEHHDTLLSDGVTYVTGSETAGDGTQLVMTITMAIPGVYQVAVGGVRYFVAAESVADAALQASRAGKDGLNTIQTIKEIHDVKKATDFARAANQAVLQTGRCVHDTASLIGAEAARDKMLLEFGKKHATYSGGTKNGIAAAGRSGNPTGCAEDDLARLLGQDVKYTKAVGIRRNPATGELEVVEIPVCSRCQGKYSPSQFPPDVLFDVTGPWGQQ